MPRFRFLPSAVVMATALLATLLPAAAMAAAEHLEVVTQKQSVQVVSGHGANLLTILPLTFGPKWTWTWAPGAFAADGANGAKMILHNKLGGSTTPFVLKMTTAPAGPRSFKITESFRVARSTDLTEAALSIQPGAVFAGKNAMTVYGATGQKPAMFPIGNGLLAHRLRQLDLHSQSGQTYQIKVNPPTFTNTSGDIRVLLARGHLNAGVTRKVTLTVTLPVDAAVYLNPATVPPPAHWRHWFVWNSTRLPHKPCVLSMGHWLGEPAGKYGWITQVGSKLMYHGHPIKLWGGNTVYGACAPPRTWGKKKVWYKRWGVDIGSARARFYARYGINVLRMHKFADGTGWQGICSKRSFVRFDPLGLSRMDSFINQLRLHGIYCELSANFGQAHLGPQDAAKIPYANEFPADPAGWRNTGEGALWFSPQFQKLQIEQEVNFLNHHNSYTGGRNADDPAIFCVELVNENDIFFWTTTGALHQYPAIRKLAGQEFFRWIKKRYHNKQALLAAWGAGGLNAMAADGFRGESWSRGIIYPDASLWAVDPAQLNKRPFKKRLLDTLRFLYHRQNAFYRKYVQALRGTGYKGLIVTSNWQAGSGYSDYMNLASDAACGNIIDRHNYFGGSASILAAPGQSMLSSGLQQVRNRPFMLSEWINVFPNQFGVEGPAVIGAYGLGLNGWGASEIFALSGTAGFSSYWGHNLWQANAPQVLGIFPAVAREVLRGDVAESKLILPRYVCVKDLFKARLGFTDTTFQNHDAKTFNTNKVPAAALAVGRCVVDFTKTFQPTPAVSLQPYRSGGMLHSSTGQLAWRPGTSPQSGYITINTPGTQAVVGCAAHRKIQLRDVTLVPHTHFAAIYVTALGRHGTIATGHRILVTTIARVYNTGMRMVKGNLITAGHAPMRVEPVKVQLTLKRAGTPTVYILNDAGQRTGKTVPVTGSVLRLDGAKTHAIYYELVYP